MSGREARAPGTGRRRRPVKAFLHRLRRRLRRLPAGDHLLDLLARTAWRLRLTLLGATGRASPHPTRPIHLRPEDLRRGLWRLDVLRHLGQKRQRDLVGLVADGAWDVDSYPLSELGIFEAVRQRFAEGRRWDEIAYFEEMGRSIDAGRPRFKYRTREDIPRQQRRIDALYDEIRNHGYRSQGELGGRRPWDEIGVAVDRDGRLLFLDGRHRLAVARVLGCSPLPALVGPRHRRWAELRGELLRAGKSGALLPSHPDLPTGPWPPPADPTVERFLTRIATAPGPVLDLEPGYGYWCQQMEARGYDTHALPGPADPRLDRLLVACGLSTRLVPVPPAAPGSAPAFPLGIALGGGEGRLWDLPGEALERRLSGLVLDHLVLRVAAAEAEVARHAGFPDRLEKALRMAVVKELDDGAGGRLILLATEKKR